MSRITQLSGTRKLLFAALTVLLLLAGVEGALRLTGPEAPDLLPGPPRVAYSLSSYLEQLRPWVARFRQNIPHEVLIRRPPAPPAIEYLPEIGGAVERVLGPSLPRDRRLVLIFGGSAAFAPRIPYQRTYAAQAQQALRQRLGDPTLEVLNMAQSGWELNSLVVLLEKVLREMPRKPAAVVLFTGNNELMDSQVELAWRPWQELALYQWVKEQARVRGWLRMPREIQAHAVLKPRFEPASDRELQDRLWLPYGSFDDASYWPAVRAVYMDQFWRKLAQTLAHLQGQGIAVVLVPPPVNLTFFPGSIQAQPVTYAPVGRRRYEALAAELERTLSLRGEARLAALRSLAGIQDPGPPQLYALGLELERRGRMSEAVAAYTRAREATMGMLGSVPSVERIMRGLAGPRVRVLEHRGLYPGDRPVHARARELFQDSCHLAQPGNDLLAAELTEALAALLGR